MFKRNNHQKVNRYPQQKNYFFLFYKTTPPAHQDITDGVHTMTVNDTPDNSTDDQVTVESVLSGDTLIAIKSTPLPQRGKKRPRIEAQPSSSKQPDTRDRYPIETKKP
jgi:hypothetical protein